MRAKIQFYNIISNRCNIIPNRYNTNYRSIDATVRTIVAPDILCAVKIRQIGKRI